jgi:hypothetical protein
MKLFDINKPGSKAHLARHVNCGQYLYWSTLCGLMVNRGRGEWKEAKDGPTCKKCCDIYDKMRREQ